MQEKLEEVKDSEEEERKEIEEKLESEFVEISEEEARMEEELDSRYAKFSPGRDYYLVFADKAPLGKVNKPDFDDPSISIPTIVRRITVKARGNSIQEMRKCTQIWDVHQKALKDILKDYVDAGTLGKWVWKYKKTGTGLSTRHKLLALKQYEEEEEDGRIICQRDGK